MKLTVEENRETIKRYGHIRPAPRWGSVRCFARCPGSSRTCTLEVDHNGPHVAHGIFRQVVAVWDANRKVRRSEAERQTVVGPTAPKGLKREPSVAAVDGFWRRVVRKAPSLEQGFLLVLFVAMVGFVIDWTLRMLG